MTLSEAMQALKSLGTAQNRKVYARHGYPENTFGVSFAELGKLKKRVKTDHALARELWATSNGDAMVLATMIADPAKVTAQELDALMKEVDFRLLADLYAGFVAKTRFAKSKMESWTKSKHDFIGQTGFAILSHLAMQEGALADQYFTQYLESIEKSIGKANNRTRHAMNMALIAIGGRNAKLQRLAIAAAARIGKVEVDHGETGCKTPDAIAYIRKIAARKA